MKRSEFRASPVAVVRRVGEQTVVLVRELRAKPEAVWKALTDPEMLKHWSPFDPSRDLSTLGDATLTMAGSDGSESLPSIVRVAEPPRLLEYTWDKDIVRWELEAIADGRTRLTLTHTLDDVKWLSRVVPGWHICIDEMQYALDGDPVERIVGDDAKAHGWHELAHGYAKQLGVAPPDDEPPA
jgi:uncharacterized protein YndB with AHSA1/START domain